MATKPKIDPFVQTFGHDEEDEEFEVVLAPRASRMERSVAPVSPIDLTGKPKLLFMVGRGGTGKTTLARWLGWRMAEQGRETLLAALDPQNRSLVGWFTGVAQPVGGSVYETSKFLKQLIDDRIAQRAGAILDFGGGDTSLTRLVESHRDVCDMLVDAGVEPVAVYTVGTGVDDLAAMLSAEREGFLPRARMIVLNEARAPLGTPRETAFRALMRSKAYLAAIQGGTMLIWMRAEMRVMRRLGEDKLTIPVAAADGSGLQPLPLAAGDRVRLFNRVFSTNKVHFGSNGDVVTVLDVNSDGIQARNAEGVEAFLGFQKLRQRNDGPIRLAYGYATTIDATQGSTSAEHIDALPEGSRAVNGLKGYVAESRHRDTTWMVVNEAAERRQIASRIPVGEHRPIRDDDIWANVAANLGRQPIKASAIEVLKRSAVVEAPPPERLRA